MYRSSALSAIGVLERSVEKKNPSSQPLNRFYRTSTDVTSLASPSCPVVVLDLSFRRFSQTRRRGHGRRINNLPTPHLVNPLLRLSSANLLVPSPHDSSAGSLPFMRVSKVDFTQT